MDAAVGSALPPSALLRRLQLAADPAAARPEIVGLASTAGVEEAARRAGRSLLQFFGGGLTKRPPSPPRPPPSPPRPPSP